MQDLPEEVPEIKPLIVKKASDQSAVVFCRREDEEGGLFVTKLVRNSKAEIRALKILDGKSNCIDLYSWFEIDLMDYYHFGMFLPYYNRTLDDIMYAQLDVQKSMSQLFHVNLYSDSL